MLIHTAPCNSTAALVLNLEPVNFCTVHAVTPYNTREDHLKSLGSELGLVYAMNCSIFTYQVPCAHRHIWVMETRQFPAIFFYHLSIKLVYLWIAFC